MMTTLKDFNASNFVFIDVDKNEFKEGDLVYIDTEHNKRSVPLCAVCRFKVIESETFGFPTPIIETQHHGDIPFANNMRLKKYNPTDK